MRHLLIVLLLVGMAWGQQGKGFWACPPDCSCSGNDSDPSRQPIVSCPVGAKISSAIWMTYRTPAIKTTPEQEWTAGICHDFNGKRSDPVCPNNSHIEWRSKKDCIYRCVTKKPPAPATAAAGSTWLTDSAGNITTTAPVKGPSQFEIDLAKWIEEHCSVVGQGLVWGEAVQYHGDQAPLFKLRCTPDVEKKP